jgi:MYXO-CTERM domain-containing protein
VEVDGRIKSCRCADERDTGKRHVGAEFDGLRLCGRRRQEGSQVTGDGVGWFASCGVDCCSPAQQKEDGFGRRTKKRWADRLKQKEKKVMRDGRSPCSAGDGRDDGWLSAMVLGWLWLRGRRRRRRIWNARIVAGGARPGIACVTEGKKTVGMVLSAVAGRKTGARKVAMCCSAGKKEGRGRRCVAAGINRGEVGFRKFTFWPLMFHNCSVRELSLVT